MLEYISDERRLGQDEKPLLVQLNWHKDDREGRFLLRRIDDKTNVNIIGCFCFNFENKSFSIAISYFNFLFVHTMGWGKLFTPIIWN